jgi:aryl-alcohol dehydrogenase-like predicted oxidoreductase
MRLIDLPKTDLRVAQIALGTGDLGAGIPLPESLALLDAYVAAGGNFIDTAHVYSNWIPGTQSTSEKTIGQWMKERDNRDKLVVATKGAHPELATMRVPRMSRADITQDITESLDYLQTETIDLYWLHRDAPSVPVGEIVDILDEQVEAGTIRYFGFSNWSVERMQAAMDYSQAHDRASFVANQPWWSLAELNDANRQDRTVIPMTPEMLEFHEDSGLAIVPFSSQARGFFSNLDAKGIEGVKADKRRLFENPTNLRRLDRVRDLAQRYHADIDAVVLAYLLHQPLTVVPIIGPKSVAQLQSSLKALDVPLTADDVIYLEG